MSRRGGVLLAFVVVGAAGAGWVAVRRPDQAAALARSVLAAVERRKPRPPEAKRPERPRAELVSGLKDTLSLPEDVVKALGVATAEASAPKRPRTLNLSGSLALDTDHLAHVHTRFAGEVVELGTVADRAPGTTGARPIRFGDVVEKGQLLAVLWSDGLGEKKSEYIDSLSKLRLEEETLVRWEALLKDQSVPERNVREARRNVESARIAVARVERTLKSWRLTDADIAAIRTEAEPVTGKDVRRDPEREKSWARVELRAPLSGTILEVNLAVGDIVATDLDLFKIADMRSLRVWAYLYEEDMPTLLSLPRPIRWTIQLRSDPNARPISGTIDKIGDLIDPNQHTALVVGQVENPDDRLRAGQFISAQVEIPSPPDELEIPIAALVEDGRESVVFVRTEGSRPAYTMRRAAVARRSGTSAFIRGGTDALRPGDRVVVSGAVELRAALAGLQDDAGTKK